MKVLSLQQRKIFFSLAKIFRFAILCALLMNVGPENLSAGTVGIWGRQIFPIIPPNTRFVAVDGGETHTLALAEDGTAYFWGDGFRAPNYPYTSPSFTGISAVAAGYAGSLLLRTNGTVSSFGSFMPALPNGLSNIVAIAAGAERNERDHYMALRDNGTIVEWGFLQGETPPVSNVVAIAAALETSIVLLSDGTIRAWGSDYDPDDPPALSNIVAIAAGDYVGLALRSDGTVADFGFGNTGYIPPGLSNVIAIAAGEYHNLALKSDGTVVAWGDDFYGATNVPLDLTNVVHIAAGKHHSLAIKSDGSIVGWGRSDFCQSVVPSDLTNIIAVAAGDGASLVLKSDGTVKVFGSYDESKVIGVPAGLSNVVKIAAGIGIFLALKNDGSVLEWNETGQAHVPAGLTSGVVEIAALDLASIALKSDGSVVTWGIGVTNRLDLTNVVAISAGAEHYLALRQDGTVSAWGANFNGQCNVPDDLEEVVEIAAGGGYSLALNGEGRMEAWGNFDFGDTPYPTGLLTNICTIAGGGIGIAIQENGDVTTWGHNGDESDSFPPRHFFWVSQVASGFDLTMLLISDPVAPHFLQHPSDISTWAGTSAKFISRLGGTPPFAYQWRKNGTNIVGASGRTLLLSHVQLDDAAIYTLVVSNSYGFAVSDAATLNVFAPPPSPPFERILDSPALFWTTGGDMPWFAQTNIVHNGFSAMQSGRIDHNSQSWIETVVYGPGLLKFWWKVDSQAIFDALDFSVNGSERDAISHDIGWTEVQIRLNAGINELRWRYSKDSSISKNSDAGWLDNVRFIPDEPPFHFFLISQMLGGHPRIHLDGNLDRGYALQSSTNLIDWTTLTNLSPDTTLIFDDFVGDRQRFYRAITP
jgi:alpha-tubulin suppressor-like RCC1 family protein